MGHAQLAPPLRSRRRGVAVLGAAALLLLAACAPRDGSAGGGPAGPAAGTPATADPSAPAAAPDAVVLQVALIGGYTSVEELHGRLPEVTVYGDGRVFTQGPVAAVHPPSAWPDVQVTRLDPGRLPELVDRALAAGVGEQSGLGPTGVVDAPSTRFTVQTDGGPVVREVDALQEGLTSPMLTDRQRSARTGLAALAGELTDLAGVPEGWTPGAVAVLAHPHVAGFLGPDGQPLHFQDVAWPGPELTGEPLEGGLTCTVVPAEQVPAVQRAAQGASTLTPWTTPDGARWSLTFRPLLPHESGCADLTG